MVTALWAIIHPIQGVLDPGWRTAVAECINHLQLSKLEEEGDFGPGRSPALHLLVHTWDTQDVGLQVSERGTESRGLGKRGQAGPLNCRVYHLLSSPCLDCQLPEARSSTLFRQLHSPTSRPRPSAEQVLSAWSWQERTGLIWLCLPGTEHRPSSNSPLQYASLPGPERLLENSVPHN